MTDIKKIADEVFPDNKDKTIIGAVITVAYDDGTIDAAATLTDGEEDFLHNLADIMWMYTRCELLNAQLDVPSALKKLGRVIA